MKIKPTWLVLFVLLGIAVVVMWPHLNVKEAGLNIAIKYVNLPPGLTVIGIPPKSIDVEIRGPKSRVRRLVKSENINYVLDLTNAHIGINSIPVEFDKVLFPKGISVVRVKHSSLSIEIDKEIEKKLPIVIQLAGKPAAGFVVADVVTDPLQIILKGPLSRLGAIETIATKPFEIDGVKDTLNKEVALDLAEDIKPVPSSIKIFATVFIEEKVITKQFQHIPVQAIASPYDYEITPPVIDLVVNGTEKTLEKISTENEIEVFVMVDGLKPGVYVRHATIRLPVGISLMGVKPEIFTIRLKEQ